MYYLNLIFEFILDSFIYMYNSIVNLFLWGSLWFLDSIEKDLGCSFQEHLTTLENRCKNSSEGSKRKDILTDIKFYKDTLELKTDIKRKLNRD